MKRILISALSLFIFSTIALANDPLNIGFKASFNTTKIEIKDGSFNTDNINSFSAGAFIRVNFNRLFLQPEAYFNSKTGEVTVPATLQDVLPMTNDFNLNTIDVPILLGYKIISNDFVSLHLHAGPLFSFVTDQDFYDDGVGDIINDNYIGWQVGAGLDLWFLTFDLRYEGSGNMIDEIEEMPGLEANQNAFIASVGIKLF